MPQNQQTTTPATTTTNNNQEGFFSHLIDNFTALVRAPESRDSAGSNNDWKNSLRMLEGSDMYKDADPKKKVALETLFFNRYVKPRSPSMDLKEWLNGRGTVFQMQQKPDSDFSKYYLDTSHKVALSVAEGVTDVAKAGRDMYDSARQKFQNLKEQSGLGVALLNAELRPHMGPIIMTPEHYEVSHSNPNVPVLSQLSGMKLDELYKASKYAGENYYQDTMKDKALHITGKVVAQTPVFMATDGILDEGLGLDSLLNIKEATGIKGLASRSVYNGAKGYLIGKATGDDPEASALGFIGFGEAARLFGKMFVWGGGKLISSVLADTGVKAAGGAAETAVSPFSVAMGGSPKQKMTASVYKAAMEMTQGNFGKLSKDAQVEVLNKLASKSPELAQNIGLLDKTATGVVSAQDLVRQREALPEFNKLLTSLEKISGDATHQTIADSVARKEANQAIVNNPAQWAAKQLEGESRVESITRQGQPKAGSGTVAPGAARAKSLEFESNMTKRIDEQLTKVKLGPDKIQFEDRRHKFLFYLNVLMTEQKQLGPSKARNREFDHLVKHLQTMFPGDEGRLPNLIKASDKVWGDIENASKAGIKNDNEVFRYWRQHSLPGQSPFAHEQELLKKAQAADELAKQTDKLVSQRPVEEEERLAKEQTEKLKKETERTSSTHKQDLKGAVEKLFPGKKFEDLSAEQRLQAVNVSLGKPAVPPKGASGSSVREASGQLKTFAENYLRQLGYTTNQIVRFKDEEVENIIKNRIKPPKKGPELRLEGHGTE